MKQIKKDVDKAIHELNLVVDSIEYKDKQLNIILDSSDVIDLDKIVEASRIINKVLDEKDYIKDSYTLDVSSKEKGDVK